MGRTLPPMCGGYQPSGAAPRNPRPPSGGLSVQWGKGLPALVGGVLMAHNVPAQPPIHPKPSPALRCSYCHCLVVGSRCPSCGAPR